MNMNPLRNWTLLILLLPGARAAFAQELPYHHAATREATLAATLSAMPGDAAALRFKLGNWWLIGPFDNTEMKGMTESFPPEQKLNFANEYAGVDKQKTFWTERADLADGRTNLLEFKPRDQDVVCYLYRSIEAEREGAALLFLHTEDAVAVWVNGSKETEPSVGVADQTGGHCIVLPLKKGRNDLLVKLGHGSGEHAFVSTVEAAGVSDVALLKRWLRELDDRLNADFPSGEAACYRIENIAIPAGIRLEVGGLAFMPDGRLMITTRRGEIWSYLPATGAWKRFAAGLHEPLGICATGPDEVVVAQRPELTRIKDTDHDGEADEFETLTDAFGLSGNYHEYHYGPVRDKQGNFYATLNLSWGGTSASSAPYRGWAYQVTPDGKFVPWADGFRSPAGLAFSPQGELFVTDNQGDWWGTSPLLHVQQGGFYGHPAGLKWEPGYHGPADPATIKPADLLIRRKLPVAWFVYDTLGRSPTEPTWDTTQGKFGPFTGQMLVGDQTKNMLMRVALEKVGDDFQGAIFPFRKGFPSSIVRVAWDQEGRLYVGGTDRGWGSVGGRSEGLQRVVWTGQVPMEISTMSLTKQGFDLTFTKPVDVHAAAVAENYSLQHYHYNYSSHYGSNQIEITPVPVKQVIVSADRRTVSLILPELRTEKVYELHVKGLQAADGTPLLHPEAYYTLNRLR